jgi:hypothetical protein
VSEISAAGQPAVAELFNLHMTAAMSCEVLGDASGAPGTRDRAMSECMEGAREGINHAGHGSGPHSDSTARRIAMLIAVLAAALTPTQCMRRKTCPTAKSLP